jgi:ABC-type uncharacterized transport system substrate-binding protein
MAGVHRHRRLGEFRTEPSDSFWQVGLLVARVLGVKKPADLSVQQLTMFELVINLRTAKALGIAVPLALLGRADEIIE